MTFLVTRSSPRQELAHEGDVGDRQTEGLYPRESLLVGEGWDFPAEFVESFVEVEHSPAFSDVGSSSLSDGCYSSPRLPLSRYRAALTPTQHSEALNMNE